MNRAGHEWGLQCMDNLRLARMVQWLIAAAGLSKKAIARAHVQARAFHSHLDLMELGPAVPVLESISLRMVADQIVTVTVFGSFSQRAGQVVGVVQKQAA